AGTSFTKFLDFALITDKPLAHSESRSLSEVFNDSGMPCAIVLYETTVAILLKSLLLEVCENSRGLPVPPMLQLLIELQLYCAGAFIHVL
ncbi:hypothetical protein HPB47_027167, partial [Ixodes persulcatus]